MAINTGQKLNLIYPQEQEKICEMLDKHKTKNSKILLIDDIDCDGTVSLLISYRTLDRLGFEHVQMMHNTKHGITGTEIQEMQQYDLIIILDSSTNECEEYLNLKSDVIVIDHHTPKDNLEVPDKIILCNSKNTEGLENISAGFLTYTVMHGYSKANNVDISDLFAYGVMSIYSDIVPVDDYIKDIISHNLLNQNSELVKYSTYDSILDRSSLTMEIIPKLNFSRRLDCNTVLSKFISLPFSQSINDELISNREKGREIIKMLSLHAMMSSRKLTKDGKENLRYVDISKTANEYITLPIKNFKGLLCNNQKNTYGVNTMVCSVQDIVPEVCSISVRSDSQVLPIVLKYIEEGGGHQSACGGKILKSNLAELLMALNECDDKMPEDLYYRDWKDLTHDELFEFGLDNEFAFSNIRKKQIVLPYNEIFEIPQREIYYNDMRIKKFSEVQKGKDVKLTPTVVGNPAGTELSISLIVSDK